MRQRRPLGDRPVDIGGAEYRPDILSRQRQPGRNDQQRDVLGKGLGNAGKGVLDARSGLDGEYAVAPAALDAGIAVRQADADALLPAQDRTDVERGAGLDQGVARIAGEKLRSLAPKDFGDDGGAIHGLVPPVDNWHPYGSRIGLPGSKLAPRQPWILVVLGPVGRGPHGA